MSSGTIECREVLLEHAISGSPWIVILLLVSTIPTKRQSCTIQNNPSILAKGTCSHASESKKGHREMCLLPVTIPWNHLDRTWSSGPLEQSRSLNHWTPIRLALNTLQATMPSNQNTITWWPARASDSLNKVATYKTTQIQQNTKTSINSVTMPKNLQLTAKRTTASETRTHPLCSMTPPTSLWSQRSPAPSSKPTRWCSSMFQSTCEELEKKSWSILNRYDTHQTNLTVG